MAKSSTPLPRSFWPRAACPSLPKSASIHTLAARNQSPSALQPPSRSRFTLPTFPDTSRTLAHRSYHTTTDSTSPRLRSPSRPHKSITLRPLDPSAAPLRHNGVYASTFKPAHHAFRSVTPRRPFSATAVRPKDHHFDTLKFVTRLKDEGFSEEQAVAMMRVLNDVIEESIQNLTRTMVLKEGIPPPSARL